MSSPTGDLSTFEVILGIILLCIAFVAACAAIGLAADLIAFFIRHFTLGV